MKVVNQHGRKLDFEDAVEHMDDELREELRREGFEGEQEFFSAYEKAHAEKYGEAWSLSQQNPAW